MSAPPGQQQQHHPESPQPTARVKQLRAKVQALQVAAAELRTLKPERAVYQRVGGGIFLRAPGKDAAAKRVAEDTRRAEAELRREEEEDGAAAAAAAVAAGAAAGAAARA